MCSRALARVQVLQTVSLSERRRGLKPATTLLIRTTACASISWAGEFVALSSPRRPDRLVPWCGRLSSPPPSTIRHRVAALRNASGRQGRVSKRPYVPHDATREESHRPCVPMAFYALGNAPT